VWYFQSIIGKLEMKAFGDVKAKSTWTRGYEALLAACNNYQSTSTVYRKHQS